MKAKYLILASLLLSPVCFPVDSTAKDAASNGVSKTPELSNSKPPDKITSSPAVPGNSGQNPVKPLESGGPGKPASSSNPETITKSSKPADPLKNGNPAEETPSGTKPADPADPGKNPANPAEPDNKAKPDKKDKTDKDSKEKKDNSGKGGKGGPSLPSGGPSPQGGGPSAPAAGGIGSGFIGGILSAGKKEEKEEKKEKTTRSTPEENAASSETVKAGAPVRSSTQAISAEMLYSAGKGSRIAIIGFEGEGGAEFAALLAVALRSDLKVYDPQKLAVKKIDSAAINRVSARKIAADLDIEYLVAGKISKKTATLSIISVFLRDGASGDVKMTENHNIRSSGELKSAAENAARKIKERVTP